MTMQKLIQKAREIINNPLSYSQSEFDKYIEDVKRLIGEEMEKLQERRKINERKIAEVMASIFGKFWYN